MSIRDEATGRYTHNQNSWVLNNDIARCYADGVELFFTDIPTYERIKDCYFGKIADGYACVFNGNGGLLVHRFITNAKDGDIVDHINRNKKDNRLCNLRITDKSENAFNSKLRTTNKSGRCGVRFRNDTQRWSAEIKKDYRKISLGCYATKEEAIKAREAAEERIYGYKLS